MAAHLRRAKRLASFTFMILRCAKCHVIVSQDISELKDLSLLSGEDGQEHLSRGFFRISTLVGDLVPGGEFILNLGDLTNTKRHPDSRRSSGCCGCDGCDGMNLVCLNGHEIGTECSDCWMPHYAHIPGDNVERIETNPA
jgi:hypothetical protein